MSRLLVRGAMVLTLDDQDRILESADVLVEGDRIVSVTAASDTPVAADRIIEGRGRLLTPGLVNAHTHSQSSTMSGFGDRLSHPAFMWLTQAHTSNRTPDETRLAVLLTAYGLLSSGTTSVIDHFPGQRFTAADMDAVLSAWRETGMRVGLAMRFFDGAFTDILPTSLPDDMRRRMGALDILKPQPTGELRGLMEDIIRRWHEADGLLSILPAPSNPDRCSDEALLICAELADRYDLGIHTHLLETEKQARIARERYGVTTVGRLERLGILSDRWSCAHSIWLDDADIDLMADRGAIAVLNPESNARLGTGTARIPQLRRRGVRLALGTDGSGSNDNLVMHEAMRAVAEMHRPAEPDRSQWLGAREALAMATTGGAAALRRARLGVVTPGAAADLVLYRLDKPWWMPMNDPVNQLVFAETGASVETVIVAGEVLYEDGRPVRFDPADLRREVDDMARSLRARNADLFVTAGEVAAVAG